MEIRRVKEEEAQVFWEMRNALDHETKFMMYEAGERPRDIEKTRMFIREVNKDSDLLLVAVEDEAFIGFISVIRGKLNRIKHSAYIIVGIREGYRGKGIGTKFFEAVDEWAREQEVNRLELTVICKNEGAKYLYEKDGFIIEGVKRESMKIDGEYIDEYYMAKIL